MFLCGSSVEPVFGYFFAINLDDIKNTKVTETCERGTKILLTVGTENMWL